MSNFMSELKKGADAMQPNISVTENGAIGLKTTGKALLDLNFMLSSMRNMTENEIYDRFLTAYNENPVLALLWLFFARDCREGCGERKTFRAIFKRFSDENESVAIRLLHLIPFYGRWDDLIDISFGKVPCKVRDEALMILLRQIQSDILCANTKQPVSLLAKWLPSLNTSSKESRRRAEFLRNAFAWTPRQYRKNLSGLRKYIDVTERKMSAGEWSEINYESVPSRAAMNYRNAFSRHDYERYDDYLTNVKEGKAKINSGVLYPYDIVHAYNDRYYGLSKHVNNTLESQWDALPNKVPDNGSTLVVVDGSGSMCSCIGNTSVTCSEVANSLGVYFAEKLKGPYYNSFITFSSRPQFVHFADGLTLHAKLQILNNYDDCSNTDLEKTFDLILDIAVKNHLKQEDIPANILIVSDMEFDNATCHGSYGWDYCPANEMLFKVIADKWASHGYKLPRLVFWNVCSRTGTIPVSVNELGVALVSGFSPNIADMVMSGELDPYKCLVSKLMSDRYSPVSDALKE